MIDCGLMCFQCPSDADVFRDVTRESDACLGAGLNGRIELGAAQSTKEFNEVVTGLLLLQHELPRIVWAVHSAQAPT